MKPVYPNYPRNGDMKSPCKMYCFVMYNLSGIQKGIQAGHAVVEHGMLGDKGYENWSKDHKTLILLNGGTSTSPEMAVKHQWDIGSMEKHMDTLDNFGVTYARFQEPDLNFATSAIAFVVYDDCDPLFRMWLQQFKLA